MHQISFDQVVPPTALRATQRCSGSRETMWAFQVQCVQVMLADRKAGRRKLLISHLHNEYDIAFERKILMERLVTVVGKNGVQYTVSLTAEQTDYYVRLAQVRASSSGDVMKEFIALLLGKDQQDTQHENAQYN